MATTRKKSEKLTSHTEIELLNQTEWRTSAGLIPYPDAVAFMEKRVAEINCNTAPETVWLLEHPPIYLSLIHI